MGRRFWICAGSALGLAIALGAESACAQVEPAHGRFGGYYGGASPFAATPNEEQSRSLTPHEVLAARELGQVELRCRVASEGRLTDCIVDHEIPRGMGLGDASLRAVAFVRLKPMLADGTKAEGLYAALSLMFDVDVGGSGAHLVFPHLSILSRRLGPPLVHPLEGPSAQSGAAVPVDADLLRRAIPPRPPQVTYDPRLAEVGACQWRQLDAATRRDLLAAADNAPPFQVVMAAQVSGGMDSYLPTKTCDPGFWTHTNASYVARLAGVVEGLSLERLEQFQVSKAQLDAVWQSDTTLRRTMTSLYKGAARENLEAPGLGATVRPMFEKAWLELKQPPSPTLGLGSPEMAAWSYWMARAWETVAVEPMTVRPLKDGSERSAER